MSSRTLPLASSYRRVHAVARSIPIIKLPTIDNLKPVYWNHDRRVDVKIRIDWKNKKTWIIGGIAAAVVLIMILCIVIAHNNKKKAE